MPNHVDLLAIAKHRLPLHVLMAEVGLGQCAKKSSQCPFHDDSSASFSYYKGTDGQTRWKCFAGCGGGDEIDFLAKVRGLSIAEACRQYIRLAGVALPNDGRSSVGAGPFDWSACVTALTPEHRRRLAEWRGYSPGFIDWLYGRNLVGLFDGDRIAFPVHNPEGNLVGCHYRVREDGSWRFYPTGTRNAPLIIGNSAAAKVVLAFESPWDMLAVLDAFHWNNQPDESTAAVATRGAANGRMLAGLLAPEAVVYAFRQNDAAGGKWLASVAANACRKTFQVVTPSAHKDANDWTRAGATSEELRRAMADAQTVPAPANPSVEALSSQESIALPPEEEGDCSTATRTFPVELLPPRLATVVVAVARCERVPAALPAVCALGVASAAIGAGLEIASAGDRVTRANLFLLADAESGSGKSQVFRRIAEPIVDYQQRLHELFRQKTAPQLASEIGLLTREIKRLENKAARTEDQEDRAKLLSELEYKRARIGELERQNNPPCITCADVTSEKLAALLAANRETLFSASPEARQIVDIVCGRYSSTKSTDEAIYLSAFSGDFLRVDRLGRDPLTLRSPCLSVLWLVQPDAMARLFETDTLAQSGFLPRFLTCHTLATPQKIADGETQVMGDSVRSEWSGLLNGLLATYHCADKPHRIAPSQEAKRLLDDFYNQIVDRRTAELSDVGQFASRYGEHAWRVALVFHAALYGEDAHHHQLDAETAHNAIKVVQWFIGEQLGVMARGRREAAQKLEDEVLDLIESNRQRKGRDFTTAREVQQTHIVPNAEAAHALLDRMEKSGLLSSKEAKRIGGGWAKRVYWAVKNPVPY